MSGYQHSWVLMKSLFLAYVFSLCPHQAERGGRKRERTFFVYFLIRILHAQSLSRVLTLVTHGLYPARLFCSWDSPGRNTGVGCYFLLQGIFLTQGLNPHLLNCRQILYLLSHLGSPIRTLILWNQGPTLMMSFNLNLNYFLTPNTVTLCDISIYILEKTVQSIALMNCKDISLQFSLKFPQYIMRSSMFF